MKTSALYLFKRRSIDFLLCEETRPGLYIYECVCIRKNALLRWIRHQMLTTPGRNMSYPSTDLFDIYSCCGELQKYKSDRESTSAKKRNKTPPLFIQLYTVIYRKQPSSTTLWITSAISINNVYQNIKLNKMYHYIYRF